jgi:hypothetical protein
VSRILWDLADGKNESFDDVELGHKLLYDIFKGIPDLDRLDDVWIFLRQRTLEIPLPL